MFQLCTPRRGSRSLVALTSLLALAASARAQNGFAWSPDFHTAGTSAAVQAMTVFDDGTGPALYAGGRFMQAGPIAAQHIARWDGASWASLGGGLTGDALTTVTAMQVFDDGSGPALFVAGHFAFAGGVSATNIAKWNGSSWSALGNGLSLDYSASQSLVRALTVYDDGSGPQLYAGGDFNLAGTVSATYLAKWDGTSWSPVGGGGPSNRVRALAVFDPGSGPRLYAGGDFQQIDGLSKPYLAGWNGASWSAVAGFALGVRSLAVHTDLNGPALYAGGNFNSGGSGVARWDGANFVKYPLGPIPDAMVSFDDGVNGPLLCAGGSTGTGSSLASVWNGTSWQSMTPLADGPIQALAAFDEGSGPHLLVGGDFQTFGGTAANFIARREGNAWAPIGPTNGVNGVVDSLCVFDGGAGEELYVGGLFTHGGTTLSPGVARWNGVDWFDLAGSLPLVSDAHALVTWDDGNGEALFAAGNFLAVNGLPGVNKIARWDGDAWSKLGTGITPNPNPDVYALAAYDDGSGEKLYATGQFQSATGIMITHWDGATWSPVGGPLDQRGRALAVYDDGSGAALYVGGNFNVANGASAHHVARWDGASWSALGSGTDDDVRALIAFDDGSGPALFAGGDFTLAGGAPASHVARWNGSAWSPLGAGCDGTVKAFAIFDDGRGPALYVGGEFNAAGGAPASRIARWDGASWEALGQGVNDDVDALATYDDGTGLALFAGGAFTLAGDRGSNHIAKWGRVCTPATTYCTAGTTSSGCVPAISGIGTPSATAASGFTIRVDQVEGQKTGHIFYGLSGALANPWGAQSSSFLCVKGPSQRTPTQNSGGTLGACDGVMQIDWNDYVATHPGSLGVPFSVGTQVWAQLYFRDPPAPKTTNLSDGLTFFVCP